MKANYDILIAGGGLAGLSASILLRRGGLNVLLVEKKSYPMHRVCGEYISTESESFLGMLGVNLEAASRIHRLEVSAPSGKMLKASLESGGIGISRYELDNQLYHIALSEGVSVLTNTSVESIEQSPSGYLCKLSSGQTHLTRLAISAHGKRAALDRFWNRKFFAQRSPYIGVKYHVRSKAPKDVIALHNFKNGYCGFSAIENDLYCLCYLSSRDNLKQYGSISKMESEVLFRNSHLAKIFRESEFVWKEPLVINEISFAPKTRAEHGIFQVGDAAGMIAPLCGNGMSMAFHGSKLLAEEILKSPDSQANDIFQRYEDRWKKTFGLRLQAGRIIQGLFGAEFTTNAMISLLAASEFATRKIIRLTHGDSF